MREINVCLRPDWSNSNLLDAYRCVPTEAYGARKLEVDQGLESRVRVQVAELATYVSKDAR
jgi:hypothetical protein